MGKKVFFAFWKVSKNKDWPKHLYSKQPLFSPSNFLNFCLTDEPVNVFSWGTYLVAFQWTLWLGLFLLCIGASTILWLVNKYPEQYNELNYFVAMAISFSSLFGITINKPGHEP